MFVTVRMNTTTAYTLHLRNILLLSSLYEPPAGIYSSVNRNFLKLSKKFLEKFCTCVSLLWIIFFLTFSIVVWRHRVVSVLRCTIDLHLQHVQNIYLYQLIHPEMMEIENRLKRFTSRLCTSACTHLFLSANLFSFVSLFQLSSFIKSKTKSI